MDYFDDLSFFHFNHLKKHQVMHDRRFHTHALNYAHSGTIQWQREDNRPLVLKAPVAYWTWPGTRFRYGVEPPATWDHYYVSFIGSRVSQWRETGLFPVDTATEPFIQITEPDAFRRAFDELLAVLGQHPKRNPQAVHLLEGLLLRLHRQPSIETVVHPRRREMKALIRRIREHPEYRWECAREAKEIGMTSTHLRRLFGAFTGLPPVQFINKCRLDRAALLLRSGDLPVKQIADRCGFDDIHYFTKLFSREHGMPPAAYRRAFQREIG
jgi:AraC-like DNA-binding protein